MSQRHRHHCVPAHLQMEYVPQIGPALRILDWFAQQPADIQVKTADLEIDPGLIRRSGVRVHGQMRATLRHALAAQYLTHVDGTYSRGPRWCVYAAVSAARREVLSARSTYSPPQHSWGRVVCEFFKANPEEELSLDDMALKFHNPHLRAPLTADNENVLLGRVRREGYLRLLRDDTHVAGPRIQQLPPLGAHGKA